MIPTKISLDGQKLTLLDPGNLIEEGQWTSKPNRACRLWEPASADFLQRARWHVIQSRLRWWIARTFTYFQPLLYQVATAGLSPDEIAAPIRWIMRSQRSVEVLMSEVRDFDLSRRVVKLEDGEVEYELLYRGGGCQSRLFWARRMGALRPGPEDY